MTTAEIAAWLEPRPAEMLALLRQWVEMETPSLEPERVGALARAVAEAFAALGYAPRFHEHALELARAGATPRWCWGIWTRFIRPGRWRRCRSGSRATGRTGRACTT